MYYNEELVLKICERYGIEVTEGNGMPTYNGVPMTDEVIESLFYNDFDGVKSNGIQVKFSHEQAENRTPKIDNSYLEQSNSGSYNVVFCGKINDFDFKEADDTYSGSIYGKRKFNDTTTIANNIEAA